MDLTDDDGPPNWGLAKITAVLDKEEFDLHWFGTYSKAKSLAPAEVAAGRALEGLLDTSFFAPFFTWGLL